MIQIYPSLISADLLNLQQVIKTLDPYVPGYHLDIMDFHFVPNLTWGPSFMKAIAKATSKKLWVHLMVDNPKKWIEILELPEGSIVDFHIETILKNENIIQNILDKKWLPGIALSPKTPVEEIFPFLDAINQANIMSVEPGASGQSFLPNVLTKVTTIFEYRKKNNLDFVIAMDGGISEKNIQEIFDLGVDRVAIANALFSKHDYVHALKELQKITQ